MPPDKAIAGNASAVLICDLDGTILNVNSFPLWVLHLIAGRLPGVGLRKRAALSLRVQALLLRRKLGRLDHRQFMRQIQSAWHDATGPESEAAADWIRSLAQRKVRPMLLPLMCQIAAGDRDAVMATAAAGEYAIALGHKLGFSHVLATRVRLGRNEDVNGGQEKLKRVQEFLIGQNWSSRPLVLLTDHIDDLPLIDHCAAVAWFGSPGDMQQVQRQSPGKTLICCQQLDATAMMRALSELAAQACSAPSTAS